MPVAASRYEKGRTFGIVSSHLASGEVRRPNITAGTLHRGLTKVPYHRIWRDRTSFRPLLLHLSHWLCTSASTPFCTLLYNVFCSCSVILVRPPSVAHYCCDKILQQVNSLAHSRPVAEILWLVTRLHPDLGISLTPTRLSSPSPRQSAT